jgi:hypothetical protein
MIKAKKGRKGSFIYHIDAKQHTLYKENSISEPIQSKVIKSKKDSFKDNHGFSFEDVDKAVEKAKGESKSNRNPIEQALFDLGIAKGNEVAERNPAYSDYIKLKLEEPLPKKLPTKNDKFNVNYTDDFTGNIDVKPIEQTVKLVESRIKEYFISCKSELRPVGSLLDAENKAVLLMPINDMD